MHLRSGLTLRNSFPQARSRVSTQGSGTNSHSPLEDIIEETSSDSQSNSSLEAWRTRAEMEDSYDLHTPLKNPNVGKDMDSAGPSQPFGLGIKYNIRLEFDFTNRWGAEIYHDPMGRYVYKTGEHLTPFEKYPWVNYQGDMYMGDDGARYEVTESPENIDASGNLHTSKNNPQPFDQSQEFTYLQGKGKATQSNPFVDPVNEVQGENPNEQAGESKGQNVSKGSITSLWTYVKEFLVWRVFQDDHRLVVL